MDRNPKAYQVLAVGSCPKEIKTKFCINEPLMKNDYLTFQVREIFMGLHPSHHITSILWETKSLASHPLRKHLKECLAIKKMKNEREGKTEQGFVYSIYL